MVSKSPLAKTSLASHVHSKTKIIKFKHKQRIEYT